MWTVEKGRRKCDRPVESHPIAQNENLVSLMRVPDLSDLYRNPCPSSTVPLGVLQCTTLPLRLLLAKILSECQGAQESPRHHQSPQLSHQKWCELYTDLQPSQSCWHWKRAITAVVASSSRTSNYDPLQMPTPLLCARARSLSARLGAHLLTRP